MIYNTCLYVTLQITAWQTQVAAVTVYSAPDDGRKERPKHVEHKLHGYTVHQTMLKPFITNW